ncbi:MAG TPA: VWA domain-containing protein [Gallionellaceae bacterium]|nr:VWA domain-containing protein [Gallionellaceae bacterium]
MMSWSEWSQIEWAHPWWALLALQPLLMSLLLKLRRRQIMHYADAHLLAWAVRGSEDVKQDRWRGLLNFIAWLLLACAVAGPRLPLVSGPVQALVSGPVQGTPGQQAIQRHELDVMLLLDVSPSMYARDISPQRLQRAKLELLDLLPRLRGERVGLIAFSGSAGLIMPLSRDYAALRYYLQIAEPALFDAPGTALASALELALRDMQENSSAQRAILLLTDAETSALSGPAGAAAWEAADKLKQAGVRLFILGVGTEAGAIIPMPDGNTLVNEGVDVVSSLDQTGFAELAGRTGGKFVAVADGDSDWHSLYDNGLLTVPGSKQRSENVQAWRELYAAFLLPALLLFFVVNFPFRLKRLQPQLTLLLLLAAADMSGHEAYAAEVDAYAAYRNHNHALAQTLYGDVQGYAGRVGEGVAAYRRKDFQYAIQQFGNALLEARDNRQREQALFNLGNSYFMAGGYRAAAEAFLGVLKYAADNQDARANLALTAGKLAALDKPGKNANGIAGRRGHEIGGALGEDASDSPVSMDATDDKKAQKLALGQELAEAEKARLHAGNNQAGMHEQPDAFDSDMTYRAALKKLELAADRPSALHKALIRIEAAREYVPLPEMPPW